MRDSEKRQRMSEYGFPRYGLSLEEKRLRAAFQHQHKRATQRGIIFSLVYKEWLKIWHDSSHLAQRGRRRGQYVMARPGDRGAYEIGNVKIILVKENIREAHVGRRASKETRAKMAAVPHPGHPHSSATIAEMKTRKHSQKARAKMSASHKGIPLSPGHCARTSEGVQKWRDERRSQNHV
jgi:hypothetical protein